MDVEEEFSLGSIPTRFSEQMFLWLLTGRRDASAWLSAVCDRLQKRNNVVALTRDHMFEPVSFQDISDSVRVVIDGEPLVLDTVISVDVSPTNPESKRSFPREPGAGPLIYSEPMNVVITYYGDYINDFFKSNPRLITNIQFEHRGRSVEISSVSQVLMDYGSLDSLNSLDIRLLIQKFLDSPALPEIYDQLLQKMSSVLDLGPGDILLHHKDRVRLKHMTELQEAILRIQVD